MQIQSHTQMHKSVVVLHTHERSRVETGWGCVQMQEKQRKKLNQVAAQEAREANKDTLRTKRQRLEAAKQLKEENRTKNDAKHGVIVSAATARKLAKNKKLRKQLVTS
jgi:hypothetical protein